jgi:hypothetical protein
MRDGKVVDATDAQPSTGCLISDIYMPAMNGWELETGASRERPELLAAVGAALTGTCAPR